MKCFSKRQEAREAVIIRKETLVLGYGGLGTKDPLVLMHPILIKKKNLATLQAPRALDPAQGSPFPPAGQKRGLVSHLPEGTAGCCREQPVQRRWGGERLAEPAPLRAWR